MSDITPNQARRAFFNEVIGPLCSFEAEYDDIIERIHQLAYSPAYADTTVMMAYINGEDGGDMAEDVAAKLRRGGWRVLMEQGVVVFAERDGQVEHPHPFYLLWVSWL